MGKKTSARLVWDYQEKENFTEQDIRVIEHVHPFVLTNNNPLFGDTPTPAHNSSENRLIHGDNLQIMNALLQQGYADRFDLIYIDPPYFSESQYLSSVEVGSGEKKITIKRSVFSDSHNQTLDDYLSQVYPRLKMIKSLLSHQGSLFVHLDWHASHYVKVLLDEIFTPQRFVNEIIWCYGGGSGSKSHFHRKHDTILWYSREKEYIFNPQYRPYSMGTLQRGLTRVKGEKYQLSSQGAIMQDWWTDINKILSPTAMENLKFPTQKPAALLERILAAASQPGSLIGDFYAGSCTTAEASEAMGRSWVCCDSSMLAIQTGMKRLIKADSAPFAVESIEAPVPQGQLMLKKPMIKPYNNEGCLLTLGIDNFMPAGETGRDVSSIAFENLIDFWEIDLTDSPDSFCSTVQVIRKRNRFDEKIPVQVTLRLPYQDCYKLGVKVYDVLGGWTGQHITAYHQG